MKRFFSTIGTFLMGLTLMGQPFASGGIVYEPLPDGSLQVVLGQSFYRGEVEVPPVVDGRPVSAIGRAAMNGSHGLTSLALPETVTTIADYAFNGCDSLSSLVWHEGITSIGHHAFARCEALRGALTLPQKLTAIGDYAFFGCHNVTTVTLPVGVSHIGSRAFMDCIQLKSIVVEQGNQAYKDVEGVLLSADGATLLAFPRKNASWREYEVPATVTTLGEYSFYGCGNTKAVTLPDGLTAIGEWAMAACTGLKSITLPASVASLGVNAWLDCRNLKDVTCLRAEPLKVDKYHSPFGYLADLSAKTLHVPHGTAAAYGAAEVWCEFGTIIDDATSGLIAVGAAPAAEVEISGRTVTITGNRRPAALYDLMGRKVATIATSRIQVAAPGIYVLVVDGVSHKLIIN